jgi:glycosyltransferase involved in cell wall biosynthesis
MNILQVSSKKGWGGVIGWMHRTALALERRGHRVWIISHPGSRFTRSAPRGIRLIPKRLGMDFNPAMIAYLVGFIIKNRIDVVVTNIQKEVVMGGLAARLSRIPNLRRVGSADDVNDRIRWRQEHLVDHTICPSRSVLETIREKAGWVDPGKYTVIYNGRNPVAYSDQEILAQRRQWGIPDGALVIGCTAQLAPVKGLDGLIRAFHTIHRRRPDCYLVISGEGPERSRLEALAGEMAVGNGVVFAGFTLEPMKAAAAYDVAVLNSFSEGFPNTIIEYLAAGRAVISTDVGGVREVLQDGQNGLIIQAGDHDQLHQRLELLIEDGPLRRLLGARGQETVREGFSEDCMVDRLEDLLMDLRRRKG